MIPIIKTETIVINTNIAIITTGIVIVIEIMTGTEMIVMATAGIEFSGSGDFRGIPQAPSSMRCQGGPLIRQKWFLYDR